ncbi:hypothetical protein NOR_08747 [Metarhizium rileyi]|uniref:Uncharacterized protein n=1 Tax=Metarhizium rileyi (strain RCEF 4871) TaxID=1649241 RepID=A0A166VQS2_METRR|nr:hypothetical protein NOR_08747 [Metarhizium rileyi RCEF 4871]
MACQTRPDPYHPETLQPGKSICDCGKTIKEALERNCVYDALATAWLPPYCRDDELSAKFDRSGPGSNGEWSYFADEAGTVRLDRNQIGLLGETGGKFWTSRNWHIAHCMFYWQKYYRMRETGAIMEERFDNLIHIKHYNSFYTFDYQTLQTSHTATPLHESKMHPLKLSYVAVLLACGVRALPTNGPPNAPPRDEDWKMTIETRDESSAAPPKGEDWKMTIETRDESSAAPPKGEDWKMTIET